MGEGKAREERRKYLESLAIEYGVPREVVFFVADVLGPSEDFDGLVIELEDYADAHPEYV